MMPYLHLLYNNFNNFFDQSKIVQCAIFYPAIFILSAIITSFLMLVSDRYPVQIGWEKPYTDKPENDQKSGASVTSIFFNKRKKVTIIFPRSYCDFCQQTIPARYLVPIFGWVFTRGRCFYCHRHLKKIYLFYEVIVPLISCLIFFLFSSTISLNFFIFFVVFHVLFLLAIMDWEHMLLPLPVTVSLFWLCLIFSPMPYANDPQQRIWGSFVGFAVLLWSALLQKLFKKNYNEKELAIGGGDFIFVMAGGAFFGIKDVNIFIIISCVFFFLYALPSIIHYRGFVNKNGRKIYLPLGTALACGWVVLMIAQQYLLG